MRRATLLLLLLCGVTFLAGLGRPAIGDSDEAFYAEAAREMIERGDWLTPYYNYETRFQKPILFYWFVAATYAVAGVGEWQARLWSALAGVGLALVTAAAGRRWRDEPTALLAGAIVATSFGYFSIGRLSLPDLPLAFFITLTIYATLVAIAEEPRTALRWWLLAGFAAGAGFLTKGPLGIIIPALVVAPAGWQARRRLRDHLRGLAAAAAVALVIGVPWYIAMTAVHGRAYLDSFFIGDNLERFATDRFNDPRPIWFYLPIIVGGMLPWSPLAAAVIPPLRRVISGARRLSPFAWQLVWWAAGPLLFFTISIGKQPRYILPILPPLALLVAMALRARLAACGNRRDPLLQGAAAVVALLLLTLAALLHNARPLIVMVPEMFVSAAIVAIAAAALVAGAAALAPQSRFVPPAIAVAGALLLGGLQYGLSPAGRDPVQDMAALVETQRQRDEPIATFRVFVRNLIFYTGLKQGDLTSEEQVAAYLRSPHPVLVVIGADELARVTASHGVQTRTLGEVLYFNASAVKLRTLLDPDQTRDLERVLLVTNR
ncbi:MAG TPA: glycosyltransferase family 39 protein [Vicinamibacterales bacterium]